MKEANSGGDVLIESYSDLYKRPPCGNQWLFGDRMQKYCKQTQNGIILTPLAGLNVCSKGKHAERNDGNWEMMSLLPTQVGDIESI